MVNSCKSAVAVGNSKLIYRYWKITCEIQKNNRTRIYELQRENKLRSTELIDLNYQRKNLGVAFQPSCDKIGNPCKSAVAVEHAKIIYQDLKTTHETQQNNWTSTLLVPHMKNKLRITSTKAIYQRSNLRVVCQNSYDNNGNSCKSAVAVGNSNLIYRHWKINHEIQKNNWTRLYEPQIKYKPRATRIKASKNYQRKNFEVALQLSYDKMVNPVNLQSQLGTPNLSIDTGKQLAKFRRIMGQKYMSFR